MNSPDRIPTEFAERMLRAWMRAGLGEMEIGIEMLLDAPLDGERLAQAFDRLREYEPVVGRRFVENENGESWWAPVADYRPLTMTDDPAVYKRFRLTPLRAADGAQVSACHLRTEGGGKLCLFITHELCDAGGLKQVASLLAHFYTFPLSELHSTFPDGSRSFNQVLDRSTKKELRAAKRDNLKMMWRGRFPAWSLHAEQSGSANDGYEFVLRHLDRDLVGRMASYGRRVGATINDMMMASFLAATARTAPPHRRSRLRMMTTADMRRYMPEGRIDRICNLSGIEMTMIPKDCPHDFPSILDAVVRHMALRKSRNIGIALTTGTQILEGRSQRTLDRIFAWNFGSWKRNGNMSPALTNMGPIEKADLDFDGRHPSAAWLLVPPIFPPFFGTGMSGYDGTLTLSAGVTPSFAPVMREFFETMVAIIDEESGRTRGRPPGGPRK